MRGPDGGLEASEIAIVEQRRSGTIQSGGIDRHPVDKNPEFVRLGTNVFSQPCEGGVNPMELDPRPNHISLGRGSGFESGLGCNEGLVDEFTKFDMEALLVPRCDQVRIHNRDLPQESPAPSLDLGKSGSLLRTGGVCRGFSPISQDDRLRDPDGRSGVRRSVPPREVFG